MIGRMMVTAGLVGLGIAVPARAENPMKVCGAKYRAAKADKTLPAGQTWPQFLSACRATLPRTESALSPSPAGQPGAARTGAPTRIQQCAAQYHVDKDAGKLPAGQRWPQYYSACSARLKG